VTDVFAEVTPVISIISPSALFMVMEYLVTTKKVKEHLGNPVEHIIHPTRDFRLWIIAPMFSVVSLFFIVVIHYSEIRLLWLAISYTIIALFTIGSILVMMFLCKDTNLDRCADKMTRFVNDDELLWLNEYKKPEPNETNKPAERKNYDVNYPSKLGRLGSTKKGTMTESTIQMLAFLKRYGTSQGMHKKIPSMGSSNAANKTLKRWALKNNMVVQNEGNDYSYVPWTFKVVDDNPEGQKIEKILGIAWERKLDQIEDELDE